MRKRAAGIAAALDGLREASGGEAPRWFRAPGRVNLMGDHTDYNEGFALPMAIDRDCLVAVRPRADGRVRARSLEAEGLVEVAADGSGPPAGVRPPWGRIVAAVVRALAARGRPPAGADLALSSTVPAGSGLASSAALEVAVALALCDAAGLRPPRREVALACREAEEAALGVPCGIMDQLVSLEGRSGCALLLDCRTLAARPVPIAERIEVLAVHSGVRRALADTPYAERRAACVRAAQRLGVLALRDATLAQAAGDPVARHVATENARTLQAARALAAGDAAWIGGLCAESHASLRDDFAVSTPELDSLVAALVAAGAIGARPTGAGFGGCVVAFVPAGAAGRIAGAALERYRTVTGLAGGALACRAAAAAGPVEP